MPLVDDNHLFAGNDALLRWTGAANSVTGAYLNAATVTAQLYDENDDPKGDPVTLDYVAGSNGNYLGVLESSVIDAHFAVGDRYELVVTLVQGGVNGRRVAEGTLAELPFDG